MAGLQTYRAKRNFGVTAEPRGHVARRKSVREINAWMRTNYDNLLEKAKRDCIALTGKPSFGGH